MLAIEMANVQKRYYRSHALRGVNLEIEPGKIVGLPGPMAPEVHAAQDMRRVGPPDDREGPRLAEMCRRRQKASPPLSPKRHLLPG